MHGPDILARFLAQPGPPDRYGNRWQYHSRSDRHSKVGSWGVALDLLSTSSLLRRHAEAGKVVLGVNHTMTDFATGRKKVLDLVVARTAGPTGAGARSFAGLAAAYGIHLNDLERGILGALPALPVSTVGAVLVALEAKACMTAHVKSLPRLYDELNSSHLCVHGASRQALAIGYVQVNAAEGFLSPSRWGSGPAVGGPRAGQRRRGVSLPGPQQSVARARTAGGDRASSAGRHRTGPAQGRRDTAPLGVLGERLRGHRRHRARAAQRRRAGPDRQCPARAPARGLLSLRELVVRMANEYDTTFANI